MNSVGMVPPIWFVLRLITIRFVSKPKEGDSVPEKVCPITVIFITVPQLLLSQVMPAQLHTGWMGALFASQLQLLSVLGDPKPSQISHMLEF